MCLNSCSKLVDRFLRKSEGYSRFVPLTLILLLVSATGASGQVWQQSSQNPTCKNIFNPTKNPSGKIHASSGAQMACFGPQIAGSAGSLLKLPTPTSATSGSAKGHPFSSNVDAANPPEDQTNGTQAYGQSETSIAAAGNYVVEAWNDATGFFAPLCSPNFKDQLTGFGFSSDGGNTFTDLGGLPNVNCSTSVFEGDPSVEVYQTGGNTYFYVSSLFFDANSDSLALKIAMDVCRVVAGSSVSLSCDPNPIIIADPGPFGFDDKDFLSIDAVRGLLYATYTDFTTGDAISLSVCDIGNGALGGSPGKPVCNVPAPGPATPNYMVIASFANCAEIEGAYPAVDPSTGDVYVAYEFNWATNLFGCPSQVQEQVAYVQASSCVVLPISPSPCPGPTRTIAVDITSMDAAFIPGYNRFPMNDFPRIAVSPASGTVSIVWNDARANPSGDILLQSFALGDLTPVQAAPVKLNNDTTGTGAFHFLPALRNVDANGNLNVSWYDRRLNPSSALTDVYAALDVNPRTTGTPKSNIRVTNISSNWLVANSDIVPNFGDYTDNYIAIVGGKKGSIATIFAAWSDGRINVPQPFCATQGL
jgi:hypothetical protein